MPKIVDRGMCLVEKTMPMLAVTIAMFVSDKQKSTRPTKKFSTYHVSAFDPNANKPS